MNETNSLRLSEPKSEDWLTFNEAENAEKLWKVFVQFIPLRCIRKMKKEKRVRFCAAVERTSEAWTK